MAEMTKNDANCNRNLDLDIELAEFLIAISVIAKQLAMKITANQLSKEDNHEQMLRTDRRDDQGKV